MMSAKATKALRATAILHANVVSSPTSLIKGILMFWSTERKVMTSFSIALLMLIAVDVITYWNRVMFTKLDRQGAQTQQFLIELDDVSLQLAETEAVQRDYLLTGEKKFLMSYKVAVEAMQKEIYDLHVFVLSPLQQQKLATLARLIAEKFSLLQRTISVRDSQGLAAAVHPQLMEPDQKVTALIQATIQELEQDARTTWLSYSTLAEARGKTVSHILIVGSLFTLGLVAAAGLWILHDLRERQRAERELRQARDELEQRVQERTKALAAANETLRTLSRQLLEAQEQERRHIARELHDELGQGLTSVKFALQMLEDAPEAIVDQLPECVEMVDGMLQQVRNLSLDLRPSLLDDLGLAPALDWYVNRQEEQLGVTVHLIAKPLEPRFSPLIETTCFRVIQEAFTNIARHAHAQQVWVRVYTEDHTLQLSVRDDGVGFDVQTARQRATQGGSLGVLGMEERVVLVGGRLDIHSAPGEGTEVCAWIPLTQESEPATRMPEIEILPIPAEPGRVKEREVREATT
jgi:signal transduction histidine kinase